MSKTAKLRELELMNDQQMYYNSSENGSGSGSCDCPCYGSGSGSGSGSCDCTCHGSESGSGSGSGSGTTQKYSNEINGGILTCWNKSFYTCNSWIDGYPVVPAYNTLSPFDRYVDGMYCVRWTLVLDGLSKEKAREVANLGETSAEFHRFFEEIRCPSFPQD